MKSLEDGENLKKMSNNYPITGKPIMYSLQEQYDQLLSIAEQFKPEWYLQILFKGTLSEFHHHLWNLPFYKKIIKTKSGILTDEYISLIDGESNYHHLFKLLRVRYNKNPFCKYKIEKKTLICIDDSFKETLEKIFTGEAVDLKNIPEKIIFEFF